MPEIWIIFRCKVVRRGDSMRYCETLLYRFPTYNGPLKEMFYFVHKTLKTTARKNIWKAHTFPPSEKNNWQGQKCMLKTVIFKVSCSQTFLHNCLNKIFDQANLISKIFQAWKNFTKNGAYYFFLNFWFFLEKTL